MNSDISKADKERPKMGYVSSIKLLISHLLDKLLLRAYSLQCAIIDEE